MKNIIFHVKKEYFDMIKSGIKRFEYREASPYWISRLGNKRFDMVKFINGYHKDSPKLVYSYSYTSLIHYSNLPEYARIYFLKSQYWYFYMVAFR